ncbi:MAG: NAD(P)-dependent oxidoreductase [Chloroflexota bacterium]|nr:NAD(P)-dependent oxidoreductase [Chloroflexota bacterium]MDE2884412.1 NAD(P)-dependent oxidoreductase [Chloroflexota bacterium]
MRIGWIGIGRMGRPMVENLIRKGFDVTVQNRSQGKVHELAAMGAAPGESFAAMGAELDEVHTCLPATAVVEQVLTGVGGVLERPKPGLIVVDHSTIHPDAARSLATIAHERGASFIDAPVSGSGPVAEHGELTIMCGGDAEAFTAARPAMEAMGRTVELMGPSGSGAATKVVSNVLMATNLAVAMEALLLADKAGLDLERLFAVIRTASGASRAWERNVPRILKREFGRDGSAWLTMKDLDHAHELAVEFGLDLQIFQTGRRFWHAVVEEYGLGEEDPSHGFTALEQRLGVTLGG